MERDLDRAAKEGGRPAADEIELEADEEDENENEVSSKSPRWSGSGGTYGESMRPFGHGRGRGCGGCGSSKRTFGAIDACRRRGLEEVNERPANPEGYSTGPPSVIQYIQLCSILYYVLCSQEF
jgi:hypothetical protein